MPTTTGSILGGKYRLTAPLADGGMGSVWRAEHVGLGHAVAVKLLSAGSASVDSSRERFDREARLAAKISEETRHVVKVTDHGVEADGTPWLVMELLQGEGLDRLLHRVRFLAPARVAAIVKQVARGLEVAHQQGVIHRDLKPANVFLCREAAASEEDAKVLDFGVAKSLWEDDAAPTREGIVLGTPGYMSPEQLEGGMIDARADVWALGAIAYRMLVGEAPFGSGTTVEVATRIASKNPTPPSLKRSEIPRAVDAVIARALSKDPKLRPKSVTAFAEALSKAVEEPADPTHDVAVVPASSVPFRTRRRWPYALALLAAAAAGVFGYQRYRRGYADARGTSAAAPSSLPTLPSASVSAVASPSPSASASASMKKNPPIYYAPPKKPELDTWNKKDEF